MAQKLLEVKIQRSGKKYFYALDLKKNRDTSNESCGKTKADEFRAINRGRGNLARSLSSNPSCIPVSSKVRSFLPSGTERSPLTWESCACFIGRPGNFNSLLQGRKGKRGAERPCFCSFLKCQCAMFCLPWTPSIVICKLHNTTRTPSRVLMKVAPNTQ